MAAPRCRLAATSDELAGSQIPVIPIAVAILADRVDAIAERFLTLQHTVAKHQAPHQVSRAEVVVPHVVLHFDLPLDRPVGAEHIDRVVAVGPEWIAATCAHLEILQSAADDVAAAAQRERRRARTKQQANEACMKELPHHGSGE